MTQQSFQGSMPQQAGYYAGSPAKPSAGLAIASLVLGIIAILGALVPVLNFFSMLLAVIGAVLGVISLARRMGGKGMAIAGVILAVLTLIAALIVNAVVGQALSEVSDELSSSAATADGGGVVPGGDSSAAQEPAAGGQQLQVGQAGTVGDYSVTVTSVNTDANAVVAQANQFNDLPTGQYVVVDVAVTYNGTETGSAWLDLDINYLGSDARNYDTGTCALTNGVTEQPDLRQGGNTTYSVCFDLPADAIAGGAVEIEESLSLNGVPQTWAVS